MTYIFLVITVAFLMLGTWACMGLAWVSCVSRKFDRLFALCDAYNASGQRGCIHRGAEGDKESPSRLTRLLP